MAWVLINELNVDTCLLINEYLSASHVSEVIDTLFAAVEIEFQNSILRELTYEGNICEICHMVEIARKSNLLTPYMKRKLQLWREEEEYIHEYDDGPYVYMVELMRWRIDCCCEY
tara:strand:+ start:976 stop:1320 length:345 start_codon:yes stop_codon:yes gene_type:complete